MKAEVTVKHFLFIYDLKHDQSVSVEDYGDDIDSAITAYRAAEMLYADQPWMDIVLIGSENLESIKKTHSTYFQGQSRATIARSIARSL